MTTMTTRARRIDVSVLTSLAQIDALRDEWRRLEECCAAVTPFQTWEWTGAVAKHHLREKPLRVFALRDKDELVGLAPFGETRVAGLRTLRFLGTALGRYSMADYQDLLLKEGREDEAIAFFCDALSEEGDWDVLHLQELPASSKTTGRLKVAASRHGWTSMVEQGSDVHMLALEGTWDDYKKTLSRSVRNDTGRQARKLFGEFDACFANVGDDETVTRKIMAQLFDLHTSRWQAAGKPGIFRNQLRRDFHMEVARRFASRRMLVLSVLQSNDEAIAVKYGFYNNGSVYHYASGVSVDNEWKRFRLGMILDFQVIEDGFRNGVHRLDFMRGESHYKDHYKMDTLFNRDMLVFRNKRAQLQYQLALSARRTGGELRRKLAEARAKLRKAA